ncbi:7-carboxy-7-deazaguanine synthase QueE [Thioalkalivibrio sp. XN8]|uniref:7-carboxy-7-deazaguanine synthase QueE n=1 Tax=Thioalkalivibrio sp. XN8 TaxID=2712863 RepID=UPI0013EAEEFC|nr:7-carboxy-7-deazaguanine synthase QueE [Thioalkalivibrio sp. XN8]NGP54761.1 7-carboxy-7-deazaguanine synthase QueE [Thioalkalivibrio sp. XN8]
MAAASPDAVRPETSLRITEIFLSVQGEATSVGWPTVFVRLTGCPLRCGYCDTAYAFHGGERVDLDRILDRVAGYGARHVCVTGGEPLAQRGCAALVRRLCAAGYQVSVETSGALDISVLDPRAQRVMDVKTPGSGEAGRNLAGNLEHLRPGDCAKFVICDRSDYQWARDFVAAQHLAERCEVLFSPSWGTLEPGMLAEWILADRLPVRFQLQLHKVLWGDVPGR